jgi:sarcosine oxidase/L-pipecolate oxidase
MRDTKTFRETTSVIIVGGGGTMGSSTALHLLRNGYIPSNITVLDTYPIPSSQSAGNDLNKIMGVRVRNKVDLDLSLEARDMWRNDELFKPWFHHTGRLDCAGQPESLESLREGFKTLVESDTDLKDTTVWLDNEDEILAKAPLLDREQIKVSHLTHLNNGTR